MIREPLVDPMIFLASLLGIIVLIIALFFVISKLIGEDFDLVNYLVVTVFMLISVTVSFLVVATFINAVMRQSDIFHAVDEWNVRVLTFFAFFIMFFMASLLILRVMYMQRKTWMISSVIYASVLAIMLTIFSIT